VINVARRHHAWARAMKSKKRSAWHPNIAECAVVGVADFPEGPNAARFRKWPEERRRYAWDGGRTTSASRRKSWRPVDKQLGGPSREAKVGTLSCPFCPRTRSGKTLRRTIPGSGAEGRDPGDLTTIRGTAAALEQIRSALKNSTEPQEVKTKPCLTLEDCKKIGARGRGRRARKNKWNVVIAILDDGGHLLWLARMDGATPANAQIAIEKGRTAAGIAAHDQELGKTASRPAAPPCSACRCCRCRAGVRSW